MAIPRVFDPSAPFIVTASGSDLWLADQESEDDGQVSDMQKKSLVRVVAPDISRAMQHGTATHMAAQCKDDPCVSIVAQAEREDFQEFSPTNTHSCFSRVLKTCSADLSDTEDEDFAGVARLPHYHLQRKQRRKARTRWSPQEEERPIIRGLWVQEIDWLRSADRETIIPPPPEFTDLAPKPYSHMVCEGWGGRTEGRHGWPVTNDSSDNRAGSDSDCGTNSICTQDSDSDSSCCKEDTMLDSFGGGVSNLTLDLMKVSGFSLARMPLCTTDDRNHIEAALGFLRGKVTQMPKVFLPPFFKDLNNWRSSKYTNEGFIFHSELQPNRCQYREGDNYSILHHIQNGSYGDVFCIRDKRTGFRCAAKKIPLSHFSGEEVSTWSALSSPRVVELFGAVREGLNVVLFMDLKPACLAQLLKEMKSLPEDLALHFLHQTLGALEHLHQRRVLHLDVKVDNVLLSADCRDTFLCDFGLSETLNDSGWSIKAFRGAALPGTETHMAPEVARGDQLSAKVDVWSSCCMLLHMLNGCPPWIRYYAHPLCLHIVNEPPPLWEVPSNCNNFTAKVFSAGLQKDADKRASAQELRRKTTKAIRAVGGLSSRSISMAYENLYHRQPGLDPVKPKAVANSTPAMYWVSPWRTMAVEEDSSEDRDSDHVSEVETDSVNGERESKPRSLRDDWDWDSDSDVDIYMGEEEYMQEKWLKTDKAYEGDWEEEEWDNEEEDDDEEDEEGWDSDYYHALKGLFPLLQKGQQHTKITSWGSGPELEYLRDGGAVGTIVNTPSPEPRDDPPSCFSCSEMSPLDGSEEDSDHSSDDLSSGVFSSCNSHTEAPLQWLASGAANQPSSNCFEGVDIWIENVQGVCLRIRERRLVKVGHVAIGISDQILGKAFTLETLDRKTVPFDQEIKESCLWLRCVPAPDRCQRWKWRVQDGKLELRE